MISGGAGGAPQENRNGKHASCCADRGGLIGRAHACHKNPGKGAGALLDGSVDAAWTCGHPYLQHQAQFSLLGVPVWRGRPLYQPCLIAARDDPATAQSDLRAGAHAFSDSDSSPGFLATASDLARDGPSPDQVFSRVIFTLGHRNVVRALAGGG